MFRMDSGYGGSHDSTTKETNEREFPDVPQNNGKNDEISVFHREGHVEE